MSDEIQDPLARLRKKCQEEKCQQFVEKLEICSNRVKSRKNTEENCHDEVIDMMRCVDHCAVQRAFKIICTTSVILVVLLVAGIESTSSSKSVSCVHDVDDSLFGFYDIHSMRCVTLASITVQEKRISASSVLRKMCRNLWKSEPADIVPMVIRWPDGGYKRLVKQLQHVKIPQWLYGETILLKFRLSELKKSSQKTFTMNVLDTDENHFKQLKLLHLSDDEVHNITSMVIRTDHVDEDFRYFLNDKNAKQIFLLNTTNGDREFCSSLYIQQDHLYNTIYPCDDISAGKYNGFCYTHPVDNCEYSRREDGNIPCICNANFTGRHCDQPINIGEADDAKQIVSSVTCDERPNMCLNGGTCITTEENLICSCPFPYQGEICELRDERLFLQSNYMKTCMTLKTIILPAAVGYLLILTIIVLRCLRHRVRNKKLDILKKIESKKKSK
ncbi:Cytochrome b-c1 complex subunit 6, mitochondrial [Trichinella nelsoni]|uniref:Cytochrome b-c1 complex subunit 6, mitochondrial n=1 Tax=Trichinella nelsoni TaxID=6336 RepID=A0A0V0S3B5_9BILA|nr:Cytochrome b-c1 complex subunit 6, mitochondrial [Trichinella nelsoni]